MKGLVADLDEGTLDWAAGLFEGEGTVTIAIRRSDETYRLVVSITNTDEDIIAFFYDRFGGWVYEHGSRGPRRRYWQWMTAGPAAEGVVRALGPHIRTRRVRDRFDLALEFREHQLNWNRLWLTGDYKPEQRRLYAEMRALNRRGAMAAVA